MQLLRSEHKVNRIHAAPTKSDTLLLVRKEGLNGVIGSVEEDSQETDDDEKDFVTETGVVDLWAILDYRHQFVQVEIVLGDLFY